MRDVVFLWENFGPMHIDRCEALATGLGRQFRILGVQWTGKSAVYDWTSDDVRGFRLVTLFPGLEPLHVSTWAKIHKTLRFCLRTESKDFFFSHYSDAAIVVVAWILTLLGRRVFSMAISKFDDYERALHREVVKFVALRPYVGFLTNRGRSSDYLQFLRNGKARCVPGHNTLSVAEVRRLAGARPAPEGLPHAARHFTAITRLVPKKNLFMLIDAYALYHVAAEAPRPLHICGSGPLETELRAKIAMLGLREAVILIGFVQRPQIARELASSLALILPSTEEQFGNVVIEAQAMGVPCIISENCGARETLLRSAINGFLIEPDNPEGLAYYMQWLAEDESLWRRLAQGCGQTVERADTSAFVAGVRELLGAWPAELTTLHGRCSGRERGTSIPDETR